MRDFRYPKSFPNKEEELFLKLILADDNNFQKIWDKWKEEIVFDNINYATLRLIPFLYLRLRKLGIKEKIVGRIKGIYKLAWYKNQLTVNAIKNIILIFNKEKIPVILLKGIPLIENIYKDKGARFLGDADILIDKKHIEKAVEILLSNNWQYLYKSPSSLNRVKKPLENKIIREVAFKDNNDVEIDIHWKLFDFLFRENREHPMSYEEIIKYSIDSNLGSAEYKMPCAEDMIIHIIVHGAEENEHRTLRWVLDTISVIKIMPINWEFLVERIKKFGVSVEVYIAFLYIVENSFIPVPESFMIELSRLPMEKTKIKEYYRISNTNSSFLFGSFPKLWYRYWYFERKGNFFTSWYYLIDYVCDNWGIAQKRQIPAFLIEKYRKRIRTLLNI